MYVLPDLEFFALFDRHSGLEDSVEDDVAGQALQRHGARRPALGAQHIRGLLLGVQVLNWNFKFDGLLFVRTVLC